MIPALPKLHFGKNRALEPKYLELQLKQTTSVAVSNPVFGSVNLPLSSSDKKDHDHKGDIFETEQLLLGVYLKCSKTGVKLSQKSF